MEEKLKKQVLDAFLVVLRPIVRILLRYGVGYREIIEVIKMAYVDVASTDFGIRGRPTNISRIAVMTGLTRKEVRRLRNRLSAGTDRISVKSTPLADVLHHWHAQDEFTDSSGRPLTIEFSGDGPTFSNLVKQFGGDVPAGAMRTEMKRVGVVSEGEDGSLTLVSRSSRTSEDHDRLITILIHSVYPLLSNTVFNTDPDRVGQTWPNKIVHSRLIDVNSGTQLRRIAADRIEDFAESIDDLLIGYETIQDSDAMRDGSPIAVGVFYFEEQDADAKYDW